MRRRYSLSHFDLSNFHFFRDIEGFVRGHSVTLHYRFLLVWGVLFSCQKKKKHVASFVAAQQNPVPSILALPQSGIDVPIMNRLTLLNTSTPVSESRRGSEAALRPSFRAKTHFLPLRCLQSSSFLA